MINNYDYTTSGFSITFPTGPYSDEKDYLYINGCRLWAFNVDAKENYQCVACGKQVINKCWGYYNLPKGGSITFICLICYNKVLIINQASGKKEFYFKGKNEKNLRNL